MTLPLEVVLDKVGFPLVRVPALGFEVAWLPVTKIQYEHYLVDTGAFDYAWYRDKLRQYNDRVPAPAMTIANYWGVFMTGLLPIEMVRFASWCGQGFRLPTAEEWKRALTYFAAHPADPAYIQAVVEAKVEQRGLPDRTKDVVKRLDFLVRQDAQQLGDRVLLCDQMLMRLGVMEYVYEDDQRISFAGWGKPNRRFWGSAFDPLREGQPTRLGNRAEGARMKQYGARLIRRID